MSKKNIDTEYSICIKGLPKNEVLAALYNRASPKGMGILMYSPEVMTAEKAFFVICFRGDDGCFWSRKNPCDDFRNELYFDYLFGRALKVDLSGNDFCPKIYNEYNGLEAAEQTIEELRSRKPVFS
ncbi:MAG: hypothetical protein WCX77_03870 [Candidatus Paceibacterota bacterium]|jgi:hypothetical protein